MDAAIRQPGHLFDPGSLVRTEQDFFSNAAGKLVAFRTWSGELGLFSDVDFSSLDAFDKRDIIDLRNMREHVFEYFGRPNHRGDVGGRDRDRWFKETADCVGDASSSVETLIGNRLVYSNFADAAAELLPALLATPVPYPPPLV